MSKLLQPCLYLLLFFLFYLPSSSSSSSSSSSVSLHLVAPLPSSHLHSLHVHFIINAQPSESNPSDSNVVCFDYQGVTSASIEPSGDTSGASSTSVEPPTSVKTKGDNCVKSVGGLAHMRLTLPDKFRHSTEVTQHTFLVSSFPSPSSTSSSSSLLVPLLIPPSDDPSTVDPYASVSQTTYLSLSSDAAVSSDYSSLSPHYSSRKSAHESSCTPLPLPLSLPPPPQYLNEYQSYWLLHNVFPTSSRLTFVESGAADVNSSVTDLFERYLCWTGLGVEPIERWASSSAFYRPGMLTVHGALCSVPGLTEGFVENVDDPHLSSFSKEPERQGGTGTVCHRPSQLIGGMGLSHVDLFVLDCEGCEIEVLQSFYLSPDRAPITVDVWVVEGNDFAAARTILLATEEYVLLTCIGTMDAVFVRKESELWSERMEELWKVPLNEKCFMFFDEQETEKETETEKEKVPLQGGENEL